MDQNLKRIIVISLVNALVTYFIINALDKKNILPSKTKSNGTTTN